MDVTKVAPVSIVIPDWSTFVYLIVKIKNKLIFSQMLNNTSMQMLTSKIYNYELQKISGKYVLLEIIK